MFKNFLVKIFESLLDTRTHVKLLWRSVGGGIMIILTHLVGKISPNKTSDLSIDILFFSFRWITYEEVTFLESIINSIIGSTINFIVGFLITSLLTFMIRKYRQEK